MKGESFAVGFSRLAKNRKKSGKKGGSLVEKRTANLPDKAAQKEKRELLETERRQNELEKRKNPVYNEEYVPYLDPAEAEENVVKNRRFEAISVIYRISKWVVLSVFVIYMAFMLVTFREDITLENFRYLMRNVDFGLNTAVELENDIVYSASDSNSFISFREYLALYNCNNILIYDTSGNIALSSDIDYKSPCAESSDKYLLVYDKGGSAYSIYSYFSLEKSDIFDHPITHAALSDSGTYAVATSSRDYQCVIYVYNGSFKLINSIMKNKNISAMDITSDGGELLVCSYYIDELGRDMTELTALPTLTNESRFTLTLEDTVVYSCSYLEDGKFVLVCKNELRFYDSDGNLVKIYSYNSTNINKYMTSESGVTLISHEGSNASYLNAIKLDMEGNVVFDIRLPSDFVDILDGGDYVYFLYKNRLIRANKEGQSELALTLPTSPQRVVCTDKDVFVCTSTTAKSVRFDDK